MPKMTGAQFMADALKGYGVTHIFFVPTILSTMLAEIDKRGHGIARVLAHGEKAAAYIQAHVTKPVVAFVAGQMAPKGKRMGHAGAVIAQGQGTHTSKIQALKKAGVSIAQNPSQIGRTLAAHLQTLQVKTS